MLLDKVRNGVDTSDDRRLLIEEAEQVYYRLRLNNLLLKTAEIRKFRRIMRKLDKSPDRAADLRLAAQQLETIHAVCEHALESSVRRKFLASFYYEPMIPVEYRSEYLAHLEKLSRLIENCRNCS